MIEVGKYLNLKVLRMKEFGVYLGEDDEEEAVLLPKKQVPEHTEIGDTIEVFVYRDSQDRKIATTNRPCLTAGEIGVLKVVSVAGIGAFMDCGLERDVLLPFKEQTTKVAEGKSYPVYMYVDKSDRLCVTMRLYQHLDLDSPYKKNDTIHGIVYEYKDHMGAFVLVEGRYSGLIPKKELYRQVSVGEEIEGRIMNVREDGISLYGFRTKQAKEIFRLLIGISGVGPKAGMALLSALSVADIQMAVLSGDAKSLTKANGIGMKGAQRIIMELHDKIELESMLEPRDDQSVAESAGAVADEDITASVAMALVSLGYSQLEAMQAIRRVDAAQEMNTEELLKAALKKLI